MPPLVLIACLACLGCDQVFGLAEVPPATDAIVIADVSPDARMLRPFGVPRAIVELDTLAANEEDPTLTADQLELVFVSSRTGTLGLDDLWVSTRPSLSSPWGVPANIPELSSADTESHPHISDDGMSIYFASNRPGGPGLGDIYQSQRATRGTPWSAPVVVAELSSAADETSAAPDTTGLLLVLAAINPATAADLYLSTRVTTGDVWSPPAVITALVTNVDEQDGVLADEGRALYFTRGVFAMRDLWLATRANATDEVWTEAPIAELNTSFSELDPWISVDEQVMVLNSDRAGSEDLYETRRLP